jgi:hypothetical protein
MEGWKCIDCRASIAPKYMSASITLYSLLTTRGMSWHEHRLKLEKESELLEILYLLTLIIEV